MIKFRIIVFVAIYTLIIQNITSAEKELLFGGYENFSSNSSIKLRLPDVVRPLSYKLDVTPILENDFKFKGYVVITFLAVRDTKEITMHCKELDIQYVYTNFYGMYWMDPENELLKINLTYATYQANNTYDVRIRYEGYLNDKMLGLYRSSYKVGNTTRWLAATQFEATFARMAFPCFDEPRFKATFIISIARKKNQLVISNMPKKTTIGRDDDRVWDVFYETPPMATYLVAFVICDYENLSKNNTQTYVRSNAIDDGAYANDISYKLLDFMATYTNVSFMLPRLKNIAIPDFRAGAMENWGLITYRETLMLYNSILSSEKNKEYLTATIAHEIVHQWFGDYVTPTWWDYLWLNEGFARYFQFILVDKLQPTWRMMDILVVEKLQNALFIDQAVKNHAVETPANTVTEIENQFDKIIYDKGGSLLYMLEHMVGSETFQKSLSQYLKNAWTSSNNGSVTPTNLWKAFQEQISKNGIELPASITVIMEKWTKNIGFPLVEVSRIPNSNRIKIKQVTYNSSRSTTPPTQNQWYIPITYTIHCHPKFDNTTPSMWLTPGNEIALDEKQSPGPDSWIIFNIKTTGYYRVNYFTENWYLLIDQLKMNHTKIHVLNRAQLIDDSFSLAIDDYLPYEIPFELMKYLDNEDDFAPWSSAITKLEYLYSLYETTHAGRHLKHYIHSRVKNQYQKVGFDVKSNDDHITKTHRSRLVNFACNLGYEPCIKDALIKYNQYSRNYSQIPADIKDTVLCVALQKSNCTKETSLIWLNIMHLYKHANVAHESITALYSLGCSNDNEVLKRYLNKIIDENDVDIRGQDSVYVYRSVFIREKGVSAGLNLIRSLMPSMLAELISNQTVTNMVEMLGALKSKITTPKQMQLLQDIVDLSEDLNKKYNSLKVAVQKIRSFAIKQLEFISRREQEVKTTIGCGGEGHGHGMKSSVPSFGLYSTVVIVLLGCKFSSLY